MLLIKIEKHTDGFKLIADVTLADEVQELDTEFSTYEEALRGANALVNELLKRV